MSALHNNGIMVTSMADEPRVLVASNLEHTRGRMQLQALRQMGQYPEWFN